MDNIKQLEAQHMNIFSCMWPFSDARPVFFSYIYNINNISIGVIIGYSRKGFHVIRKDEQEQYYRYAGCSTNLEEFPTLTGLFESHDYPKESFYPSLTDKELEDIATLITFIKLRTAIGA